MRRNRPRRRSPGLLPSPGVTPGLPGLTALLVALAALAPRAGAQVSERVGEGPVTRYVRVAHDGDAVSGILDGETVRVLDGAPYADGRPTGEELPADDVAFLTPVDPQKISKVVGTAVNTERPGLDLPPDAHPRWFAKFPTSLSPDGAGIELPPEAENLNYEGELVVVMGRKARHVSEAEALDHVFAYGVGNDYSENTWYGERRGRREPSRMIAKGSDTWANLGPVLVRGIDYRGRRVVTRLNGEIVQDGNTDQIIQEVPELVSHLSRYVTLLPGDVIYTGTVPFQEDVRRRMRVGDRLEVSIEGIGSVRSTIVPMGTAGEDGADGPGDLPGVRGDGPPDLRVDPSWPAPLPERWILGQVSGIAVDDRDHVWIVQRPRTLTEREAGAAQEPPLSECCVPAPSVIEFDREGRVVQAWGGPHHLDAWPGSEHGIFVDRNRNVWIGSNGPGSTVVLKFGPDGEHLLTLGVPGEPGTGGDDTRHLNQPADVYVDDAAGEVYVADGYGNRRVIVFDAETGEYRRHWGAYGEPPRPADPGPYDPDAPPARHFRSPVHGLQLTADGLVYVADRTNDRIQVFRTDGSFVREAFVAPRTLAMGSVWDLDVSADPGARHLYVADGTNMKVWILRRSDLEVVGSFGRGGRQAGQFNWVHNVAVDSRGNVYTTEVNTGKRVQKFVPRDRGGGR